MLEAGVDIRKTIRTAGKQSSDHRLPRELEQVSQRIASGRTLAESFGMSAPFFPPLVIDLVNVGEQTGNLPEVFHALARYYDSRIRQLREFRAGIAWPAIQLVAAICIIGLLIFILGLLPAQPNGQPFDVTGIGLYGSTGALTWFGGWGAIALGAFVVGKLLRNNTSWQIMLHPVILGIPVIGHCMRSFAISRFSWCFALTQQAGMSIKPSLECSLKATGNGAFIMAQPLIWEQLAAGESITDAFTASNLFTTEFLQFVATAEETGTVPEQLDRMSHLFEEDAHRAMKRMTAIMSGTVWFLVAGIVIFFIFRIALIYVGMLNDAVKMAL
jgi:type IV pilus assembly protein PilC